MASSSTPLISVVCVVLNEELRLSPTLDSLVSNLPALSEIVVVDGGSTDSTLEIIESYKKSLPSLRLLRQSSKGLYEAMNEGSQAALGKYLYFINAGDYLLPSNALELIANGLRTTSSILGLAGVRHETANRFIRPGVFELEKFLAGRVHYNHQGTVFERKALLTAGGYSSRFGIMADFALMAELAKVRPPRVFDLVLASYEGGGISESRSREIPYLMHDIRCVVMNLSPVGRVRSFSFAIAQGIRRHGWRTISILMSRRSAGV